MQFLQLKVDLIKGLNGWIVTSHILLLNKYLLHDTRSLTGNKIKKFLDKKIEDLI